MRAAHGLKFGTPTETLPKYLVDATMRQAPLTCEQRKVTRARNIDFWRRVKKSIPRGNENYHANLFEEMDRKMDLLQRGNNRFRIPLPAVRIAREKWDASGVLHEPLLFPDKDAPAVPPVDVPSFLRRQQDAFNAMEKSIHRDSAEDRKTVWDALQKEVEHGYAVRLGEPHTISPELWREVVWRRRFVVLQLKQDKAGYVFATRAIDDGGTNGAGDLVTIKSRIDVHTIDRLVDTSKLLVQNLEKNGTLPLSPGCSCVHLPGTVPCGRRPHSYSACTKCGADGIGAVVVDQSRACRIVSVKEDKFVRCIPAVNPTTGVTEVYHMRRLMFGESGSPLGYNCVARCLAMAISAILLIPMSHYYDDFVAPVRLGDPTIIDDVVEVFTLLEFPVSDKNQSDHKIIYLGVQITYTTRDMAFALTKFRSEKLLHILFGACDSNSLRRAAAGKLQGELSWSSVTAFGRVGAAMTRAISQRASARNVQPRAWLNTNLRAAILWWIDFLQWLSKSQQSRKISLTDELERGVVYADVSEYGLGVTIFMREFVAFISYDLLTEDPEDIGVWECAAVLLLFRAFAQQIFQVVLLAMVDNNGVLGGLCKGYSKCERTSLLTRGTWFAAAKSITTPWWERVESEANIADAPSRLFSLKLKAKQNKQDWLKSVRRASNSTVPIFEVRAKTPKRTSLLNALMNDEVIFEDWSECDA